MSDRNAYVDRQISFLVLIPHCSCSFGPGTEIDHLAYYYVLHMFLYSDFLLQPSSEPGSLIDLANAKLHWIQQPFDLPTFESAYLARACIFKTQGKRAQVMLSFTIRV